MRSSARTEILGKLTAALGATVARKKLCLSDAPRPDVGGDLLERFRSKAEALSSTTDVIDSLADVPLAVLRYLGAYSLGRRVVASPDLVDLTWQAVELGVELRGANSDDVIGVTGCHCAIAETGTLMLLASPATPPTVSLLPEVHIAVVRACRIVATMEDAFALVRQEYGSIPPMINLVSGPSRTGDIEQTIVLGAHGPCRVHLIIVK